MQQAGTAAPGRLALKLKPEGLRRRVEVNVSCLVTGANGFIGTALCQRLRADGHEVVAAGRRRPNHFADSEWRTFDLAEAIWPEQLLQGISRVFHLAAIAHTGADDAWQIDQVNHHGSVRLAALARRSGVKTFVFASSILATSPDDGAYACAKYHAEQALMQDSCDAMRLVILRPALVYGPGAGGNLALIIRALAAGRLELDTGR